LTSVRICTFLTSTLSDSCGVSGMSTPTCTAAPTLLLSMPTPAGSLMLENRV
jgi:hypothetical protein